MMIRRTLNNQTSVNLETQRENIFHTRCKVFENICSLIVDNGSCCNCCSARMVENLNLQVAPLPKSYKLQWINEDGELTVDKQGKVDVPSVLLPPTTLMVPSVLLPPTTLMVPSL